MMSAPGQILFNCRRAVPEDGVLLLVEYCVGEANTPSMGKTVDLVMLTLTGGKERTVCANMTSCLRAPASA